MIINHRSNLYRGVTSPLPEPSCLNVGVIYQDLPAYLVPMITTMAISRDVPLVDSVFSLLKRAACCLTKCQPRQCPETCPHSDAPSPPQLPLCDYRFGPSTCSFIYTLQQHHHMASLKTPLETAHKIEEATKEQS